MKTKTPAIPYIVWMDVFVVVPLLLIVVYAFTNYDGKFTAENFTNIDVFLQESGNSLDLAAADMKLSEVRYAMALEEAARRKEEFPPMSDESLKERYPGRCQSVAQVLHNTDERLSALTEK